MSADVEQALPYLCNRSKQKSELEEALRQHRELRTGRPLLCVIHGDEYECHDKFLERLRTVDRDSGWALGW